MYVHMSFFLKYFAVKGSVDVKDKKGSFSLPFFAFRTLVFPL